MDHPGEDLAYLQAAAADLERFLLTEDIFWPVVRAGSDLQFSLGGLLLVEQYLQAADLSTGQSAQQKANETAVAEICERWRSHWLAKAEKEFAARLNLWRNFLDDYQRDPIAFFKTYPAQVRQRAILALLSGRLDLPVEGWPQLAKADDALRAHFASGTFVWQTGLQSAFSPEKFWFLYGALTGENQGGFLRG
jgi:hypothetical protein